MNVGKTLFAQVMEFIPWTSFTRIVDRYSGNAGVRRMSCADQFRVMAFAQLTWRESLRDIEVRGTGVICDQAIAMNGFYVSKDYPEHLRRIRFKDPTSGKTLVFLTNNTTLPALTIAALYKNRWKVELFFKWIKQHLRIKKFLGTSENAVKTQIWCAVSTYVLIAIVKKELQLEASLYTLLQILSVSVFEKIQISCAFQPHEHSENQSNIANQLNLFEI